MARSTPPSLNYQPLSDANNDIRILIIEPSNYLDDRISCRLEHVPLAASSDYVALSYCWGRPTWSVPVTINGTTTYITPSLADSLSVLRQRGFTRVWADAICINQADMEERSRQVLRMAAIYRSATDVLARPGDANGEDVNTLLRLIPDVKKLLKFGVNYDPLRFQDTPDGRALRDRTLRRIIRQVRHMRDKRPTEDLKKKTDKQKAQEKRTQKAWSHIRSNLQDKRWEALARLLRCEYWSRVWIIQELAMANHLQVVWGFHPFSFGDIALLVIAFDMLLRAKLVGNVLPTKACSHVKSLMEFQNLQRRLTAVPLIRALWMSSFAKATDPRDKVYSLTGLTYDGTIIFPTPSYGRGLDDIKREATLRIIQINDSLDHLVFRSVPPGSWVIDWFDARTWSDSRAVAYLTGQAKFRAQYVAITTWSASGSSRPRVSLKDDRLEIKGAIIDTIRDCSATYSERGSTATAKTSMRPCKKKDTTKQIDQCFHLVKREND
ncbi:heterokaryon incompatibility [Fusarium albosuccineum]|uniref:Heterokaryon incompatibility n=1 Tax=Fusarium albosuccineum TaxID=1237068 RepID=A0A8H4LNG1_9HYPO|nr:heterokaryon incompatibility [Fusarium albosuccineum]